MLLLTADSAPHYLRDRLGFAVGEPLDIRELAGGVSNAVFLVTLPNSDERFVLKQARGQLRVQEEWLCPVERIWREVETLRACGEPVEARSAVCGVRSGGGAAIEACVPRVLWEDRENFCYAMTAAPVEHRTWKEMLLAGETAESLPIAAACGRLLGMLHAGSWNSSGVAEQFDDRAYFDQLRLDPYYRHVARVSSELAPRIDRLINSVWQNRRCLVHGDFSPKNLLVWPGHVMLIDFEVGHYGDPAFDLGFFLTHLALKGVRSACWRREFRPLADSFWNNYREEVAPVASVAELEDLERRMLANLAGCVLARIDGKSPVDYLTRDQQDRARGLARSLLERLLC